MSDLSTIEKGIIVRKEIYDYIIRFIKVHNYSPTIREIGDGVGLKSTSSVCSHLTRMCNDKMLSYNSDSPRTIVIPGYAFIKLPEGMTQKEAENILQKIRE